MRREEIAKRMDQAVLKPGMTDEDIRANAEMCRALGVGNLCVRPTDVAYAKRLLAGSDVAVSCVIGFPHGAARKEVKVLEARLALEDGASELDLVMNIGKFLSGDMAWVREEIQAVAAETHAHGALLKVILETCLLTDVQMRTAAILAVDAGADYVKTSTGFNGEGATVHAVEILLDAVKGRAKVKASGGIRTWQEAVRFVEMGVDRLGVSGAKKILEGAEEK